MGGNLWQQAGLTLREKSGSVSPSPTPRGIFRNFEAITEVFSHAA
jgi:hypothetical protein